MLRFIVFSILLRSSTAVIYELNETEYSKMPALYALDDYATCLAEPGGTYCVADFALAGEGPLMEMIQDYSAFSRKHFNHTQIHRGVCVTRTCERFIKHHSIHDKVGLRQTLEACQNHTIWRNYNLEAKLEKIQYCKRAEDKMKLDNSDLAVGIAYLIIFMLSALGSFYDSCQKNEKSGNPYLLAFSLRRNWKKLVAPSGNSPDPRLERLKLFHGMRTITMFCVIFSHTVLMMSYGYVDNPLYIETAYKDPMKQILFNGSLVVHTFFVISSFLLAFNLQIQEEKSPVGLMQWPKGVLLRWLRLSPAYALTLATISTWMRHLGSGPLWELLVGTEAVACRRYWWAHLLYVNNYVYDDAFCAPQTWYLAADMQLFCFGLLVCLVCKTKRARVAALAVLFPAALAIVAFQTYFQNLDAVVLQKPESYRNLYAEDATFRELYIRGHTNLSAYIVGITGGFLTYYGLNQRGIYTKYRSYRWVLWLAFPVGVGVILTGWFFYQDGEPPSSTARIVYAMLYKTAFQLVIITIIIGCIFKLDTAYRSVMEWRGWTWAGRVSYGAFLLHTLFQRGLVGSLPRPTYITEYMAMTVLVATLFLSFSAAALLFLFVEAPVAGVVKAALAGKRRPSLRDRDGP